MHVLICLLVSNDKSVPGSVPYTLALSIFSGGFGIAKFMKTGPCKMVPNTSGFLDGFIRLGFPAVMFSIIATFVGKGLLLPVFADGAGGLLFSKVAMWMALNLLPQFIYCISSNKKGPCIFFCFCLVMLSFCLFLKTEGFHLYFLQFRKTFCFADKTEGFLNH